MEMNFTARIKELPKAIIRKYIVYSCIIPVTSFVLFYIFKSINGYGNIHNQTYYILSELFLFLFFFGFFIFWGIIRITLWVEEGNKDDSNKKIG